MKEKDYLFFKEKYNISINLHTLSRYMKKLGLHHSIWQAKKRELKNTNIKFLDIANKDYDGKNNDVILW